MKISRSAAIALCARAWKISPDEIEAKVADNKLSLQQIMSAAYIEIACNPFSAEALTELLFPGRQEEQKQREHKNTNNDAFARLWAMKKAKQQQTADPPTNE